MSQNNILLESGTNELEIVEFGVANGIFGINVAKVHQILQPVETAIIPNSHPCVEGLFQLRKKVIPLIDLSKYLNLAPSHTPENDKFIVTEFNGIYTAFHVHSVSRIHRISWENIEPPTGVTNNLKSIVIGVIKMGEKITLLLDFEKIVYDMAPSTGLSLDETMTKHLGPRTKNDKLILIAEDSEMLRVMLVDTLKKSGYTNTILFKNGKDAWDYLHAAAEGKYEKPDLIITDIEMPQMDGHHLTKLIRDTKQFMDTPLIIFSSLINEAMQLKGESLGATAQISKPQIFELITLLDKYLLNKK